MRLVWGIVVGMLMGCGPSAALDRLDEVETKANQHVTQEEHISDVSILRKEHDADIEKLQAAHEVDIGLLQLRLTELEDADLNNRVGVLEISSQPVEIIDWHPNGSPPKAWDFSEQFDSMDDTGDHFKQTWLLSYTVFNSKSLLTHGTALVTVFGTKGLDYQVLYTTTIGSETPVLIVTRHKTDANVLLFEPNLPDEYILKVHAMLIQPKG